MMEEIVYVIDASSLIAIEDIVSIDFFQPLFATLTKMIQGVQLISSEEVFRELKGKDGDIYKWAKTQKDFFSDIDQQQAKTAKEILKDNPKLIDNEKRNAADPFIIAICRITKGQQKLSPTRKVLVTEEKPSKNPNKPKIPDVCAKYNIECINLNEFLKREMHITIQLKRNDTVVET